MLKLARSTFPLFVTSISTTQAGYCTWGSCNGPPSQLTWCHHSQDNCESTGPCGSQGGCNGQWCTNGGPTSTPGYCNWSGCNGVAQGGCCSDNQFNCANCGGGDWCSTAGPTPPPTPSPTPAPTSPTPSPTPSPTAPPTPAPTPAPVSPPPPTSGQQEEGYITMWTNSHPGPLQGSSCETASAVATQQGDAWLEPYVDLGNYCAVSDDLFNGGEGCGRCFRVTYDGVGGTDPGTAGSADIQVVNSGAGGSEHFDCFITAHTSITGATTGIFPVTYEPIDCVDTPTTVVILDGNNAWYVKVVVAGGKTGVAAVDLTIGTSSFSMYRNSGATWAANGLGGLTNQNVKFDVTYSDGVQVVVDGCFGGNWPVATGSQCIEN